MRSRPQPSLSPAGRPINPLRATGVSPTIEESYALQAVAQQCGIILEVGTAWGYSAILMALTGAQVWTVDPHTDFNTWTECQRMVKEFDVIDRVRLFKETSQDRLPVFAAEGAQFDGAFIDGDHTYDACQHDLRYAKLLVRPGGWIAAHDYIPAWPGVWQACDEELPASWREQRVESLLIARLPG